MWPVWHSYCRGSYKKCYNNKGNLGSANEWPTPSLLSFVLPLVLFTTIKLSVNSVTAQWPVAKQNTFKWVQHDWPTSLLLSCPGQMELARQHLLPMPASTESVPVMWHSSSTVKVRIKCVHPNACLLFSDLESSILLYISMVQFGTWLYDGTGGTISHLWPNGISPWQHIFTLMKIPKAFYCTHILIAFDPFDI